MPADDELEINGIPAVDFIKQAYDLDKPGFNGRYDQKDPIQAGLNRIKGWITMAEHDAITESRRK
jgi:hypothetical protein